MTHSQHRTPLRAIVTTLVTVALAGSLTACSTTGSTSTPGKAIPATGVDDGTTLKLWTRATVERQARKLVNAYNSSHKNQVDLTVVPFEDYVTKVGAAAGAGGLPDLFAADIVYIPNWVKQGLYQDITPHIDALAFKDKINQGHLTAGVYNNKEHVLPFVLDLSMMLWNKTLFKEAGLDPDAAPKTLAEVTKSAKAIQALNKPGVYGTALGLNCGGCLVFTGFPSVWASGNQVLSADGTQSLLANNAAKAMYTQWRDLWLSGAVLPSSRDENGATWTAGFNDGKVGVQMYPATLLPSITFDAGVAGIPGPDGGASTFVGGDGIGVSKDSKKVAQAWSFLSWTMSEDAQVGVLAKDGSVVSRSDFADNQYALTDPRLVTINQVAAKGETPIAVNFQQTFNAPGSPWLTLVRNEVLGKGGTVDADNAGLNATLGQ
ncbi:MAG: sugar ABC transporter substrate-binding protein [Candidatus Lumbricidophila eiseniae]|uniref:Sugar ABC transporter substrate-binding protein n=1 Tax=Candidatus Lumbricidiphila eiseniae TaxID=1969409 RepID=A0A2A6FSL5_9MICO|nr:MAG: sugar ABC transporter substrate-binding protein [Candidatus Lumbricidophila eiseniae]